MAGAMLPKQCISVAAARLTKGHCRFDSSNGQQGVDSTPCDAIPYIAARLKESGFFVGFTKTKGSCRFIRVMVVAKMIIVLLPNLKCHAQPI